MSQPSFRGVLVPALTPFQSDLSPDAEAFLRHCRWLLEQGADGLAVFGTTSEANSMSVEERMMLLEYLLDNGIPAGALMPGTGMSALADTVRLTAHAVSRGCAGVLMLPPFYYKGVSDDGLFASYSEVIERVGDAALKIYLYHIPPIAQVGISLELIGRLLDDYADTIVGLKDSSGDWQHTAAILKEYPALATFCGSEVFLLETMRNGGAGSITATGNVNPAGIREIFERWQESDADSVQARVTSIRRCFDGYAPIPALKAVAADFYEAPAWRIVRPPLCALNATDGRALTAALGQLGFNMARTLPDSGVSANDA
ncbi:MAG: dihydrodipicolinate synthase family protein [Gammaproteobacteria bacterium]|nr:MAG: dihydrodipicolinate synthase family protein [Gammaproteobacteria bacterium]